MQPTAERLLVTFSRNH